MKNCYNQFVLRSGYWRLCPSELIINASRRNLPLHQQMGVNIANEIKSTVPVLTFTISLSLYPGDDAHSVVKNRTTTPIWAPIGPCSKPTETNQETDHFLACNCWNKTYMTKDYRHSFRTKSGDWSSTDATMPELVYTWYRGNFQVKINKWYRKCQVSRNPPRRILKPPKVTESKR